MQVFTFQTASESRPGYI